MKRQKFDKWTLKLTKKYLSLNEAGAYFSPYKYQRVLRKQGIRIPFNIVKDKIESLQSYALHRKVNYKFRKSKNISHGYLYQLDVDLADLSSISQFNDNYRYLLIAICTFSRHLYVQPLKDKRSRTVLQAFKKIFADIPDNVVKKIRSDSGTEFINKDVKRYFKSKSIESFTSTNENKASFAERVIRTLKMIMTRYFTQNNTKRYIDDLQRFVNNYNNTPHRSIFNMTPAEVNFKNQNALWKKLYLDTAVKRPKPKFKYKIGQLVRISHNRRTFSKDSQVRWTRELFQITSRYIRQGSPIYTLKDFAGERISGNFYQNELQLATHKKSDTFLIDEILKQKTSKGKKYSLVSYLGWPKKYNEWIPNSSLLTLPNK